MKIKYEFVDETSVEIEVSEEIGTVIVDSRRDESSLERKERRHCYSLDAITYEGKEYGKEDYHECLDESIDRDARVRAAFDTLTDVQKRRLLMLADGLSMREIARREGIKHHAVMESIEGARKKFLKNFK